MNKHPQKSFNKQLSHVGNQESITDGVILKPKRNAHVFNRHPWVFMGAVAHEPAYENGAMLRVFDSDHQPVGYGFFHHGQSVTGRMFYFGSEIIEPEHHILELLGQAAALREKIIPKKTTAYRVCNGEGDGIPGLIIDKYDSVLVLQINLLGVELLKQKIVAQLKALYPGCAVYEKCDTSTRKKEGLLPANNWLTEPGNDPVHIQEYGISFRVELASGQKTGFFLDQREMRRLVQEYAHNRTALNCFSYTGGFSMYAANGGARTVATLDSSASAIAAARENFSLNETLLTSFQGQPQFFTADCMEFLRTKVKPGEYDFIILDPPAFAKRSQDIVRATRAYTELNQRALELLPSGGLLLTSSCSSHITRELFQTIVFQAAKRAGRSVRILSYHQLAADHPINLYFPEGDYLKSLLLWVT